MASEHDLCAACGHHRERHHPSCHVFPCACQRFSDVAPAPPVTPGLLAAAQAIDAMREWIVTTNCTCSICVAMDALRAELAAATAGPVVLEETRTVPRVLATFADAAALVAVLAPALRRAQWVHWGEYVPDGDDTLSSLTDTAVAGYVAMAKRVAEMALGVNDDQG